MIVGLAITSVLLAIVGIVLAALLLRSTSRCNNLRIELARYGEIADLERYANEQRAKADAAIGAAAQADTTLRELHAHAATQNSAIAAGNIQLSEVQRQLQVAASALGEYKTLDEIRREVETQKQKVNQYNKALGNFKTADELRRHISQQTNRVQELKQTIGRFESIPELDQQIANRNSQVESLTARARDLDDVLRGARTAGELQARIQYQHNLLAELQAQAQKVEEAIELQEFGFYRPKFDFPSSSMYEQRLDQIRDQQTAMVKANTAVRWEKTWMVEGSEAQGRKMMTEQTKLMLRAFNGECDAAVAKVKYSNATTLETRINRSCEQINKLGKTNSANITDAYLQLKLQELYLVHEHRLKQQEEKEEQQRIRDQIREEERVQKELERAQEKAQRDEEIAEVALERARLAFEKAAQSQREATEQTKVQNAALAAQVSKLENELKEAIDRKAKAIARAQLTKSGHVYILSNIGSFGEGMFKLGLTRRLDPYERVDELGDASVPFPFDVHAIIYCENAPELECKLHRRFAERRVNLVNLRREYFHVTLDEIITAVSEFHGQITFVKVPEAAEYRETLAKRKAAAINPELLLEPPASRVPELAHS
jgi:hypothetical protein